MRDVAHLFTGRNMSGNVIGRAWAIPGPICSNSGAYCVSQSDFNNIFSCATDLSAHELGHLWGAFHCNCNGWTMNPSITCANRFIQGSINSIVAHRNSRGCLNPARPDNDDCDDATLRKWHRLRASLSAAAHGPASHDPNARSGATRRDPQGGGTVHPADGRAARGARELAGQLTLS